MSEIIAQPIFDFRECYLSGAVEFFRRPWGVDGATDADTCMHFVNQLPDGQAFSVQSVGVMYPAKARHASLRVHVGAKTYLHLPLDLCRIQRPGDRGYPLEIRLLIKPPMPFGATVHWPDAPKPGLARVGVVLFGELLRPTE